MILYNKHIEANTVFHNRKIVGLEFFDKTGIMHFATLFETTVHKSVIGNTNVIIPYILESNPHPFYSFRGLKIRCGLDSRAD
jgi:hypothetical protein